MGLMQFALSLYCDYDLKKYMKSCQYMLSANCIKSFTYQMLNGLAWCHSHRIFHRDLKPQNELVTLWYRAPEILLGGKQYSVPVDIWSIGTIIPEMVTGQPLFPGDSEIDELFKIFRLLGTPNENLWQGVQQLPDFKAEFPKWKPRNLREIVQHPERLNDQGLDLIAQMLKYTPNERIVAKDALEHPYFANLDKATVGTIPLPI